MSWLQPDLPLVPCSGCGSTAASAHVYGVSKCCPDCRHVLEEYAAALTATVSVSHELARSFARLTAALEEFGVDLRRADARAASWVRGHPSVRHLVKPATRRRSRRTR